MAETKNKAKNEITKRSKPKNLDKLAKTIGYGALKYSILKVSPEKNVIFDWQTALSFEGESGPYIQYAHARICSILKKYVLAGIYTIRTLLNDGLGKRY